MISKDMADKLKRSLISHEGCKNFPYLDTANKITIGIGYNLTDRGLDDDWINKQYVEDVAYFYEQLSKNEWFTCLNEDRQIILIDMCFMGYKHLMDFTEMIEALEQKNYRRAAYEMENSEWAKQVPTRANDLMIGMLTGTYQI